MVVTSPPYWGLRDYGIEPQVWGGRDDCGHEWGTSIIGKSQRQRNGASGGLHEGRETNGLSEIVQTEYEQGSFCLHCNAWRGVLGLEPTPELFIQHIVEVFREVRRVLRKDGTCWVVLGDSYCGGGNYRGTDESTLTDKQRSNRGAHGELAIGRTGVPPPTYRIPGLKPKDLVGIPWRCALALQQDGWWLRSDIIWNKKNPMPGSQRDRVTTAHEYVFMLAKSGDTIIWRHDREKKWVREKSKPHLARIFDTKGKVRWRNLWRGFHYYFEMDAIKEPLALSSINRLTQPTLPTQQRSARANGGAKTNGNMKAVGALDLRSKRSVWETSTQGYREAHFATFPEDLIRPMILAGCPPGGIVFDPFVGSGTVVKVANESGRTGIGIDLKLDYLHMARRRNAHSQMPLTLF